MGVSIITILKPNLFCIVLFYLLKHTICDYFSDSLFNQMEGSSNVLITPLANSSLLYFSSTYLRIYSSSMILLKEQSISYEVTDQSTVIELSDNKILFVQNINKKD